MPSKILIQIRATLSREEVIFTTELENQQRV
jgi:hypothetical protein